MAFAARHDACRPKVVPGDCRRPGANGHRRCRCERAAPPRTTASAPPAPLESPRQPTGRTTMKRSTRLLATILLSSLLLLPGCSMTLLQFLVPFTALGNSTIEVVVIGNQSGGTLGDRVGAV